MIYRNLRIKATGAWINVLYTADVIYFNTPSNAHRHGQAVALGLRDDELEVVDSDRDQRTGSLIEQPVAAPHGFNWDDATTTQRLDEVGRQVGLML